MANEITRFPPVGCPSCGKVLDAAGPPTAEPQPAPESGDTMICFGYTEPAIVEITPFGVRLRKLNAEELAEFAVDHGHHAERLTRFLDSELFPG